MLTFDEKTIDLVYRFANVPEWLKEVLEHFKTYEISEGAVEVDPCSLAFVPDRFKTQEICNKAVRKRQNLLYFIPDHFKTQESVTKPLNKTYSSYGVFLIVLKLKKCVSRAIWVKPFHLKRQEMCNEGVAQFSYVLRYVSNHFKTQGMCKHAVRNNAYTLKYVPDWFATHQ